MPLVRIQTNTSLDGDSENRLAAEATAIVARELGKPESITMAVVESGRSMTFGGTTEPTALIEVEGIELSADTAEGLSESFSNFSEDRLGVPASRTFVKLTTVPRGHWAGNRKVY